MHFIYKYALPSYLMSTKTDIGYCLTVVLPYSGIIKDCAKMFIHLYINLIF